MDFQYRPKWLIISMMDCVSFGSRRLINFAEPGVIMLKLLLLKGLGYLFFGGLLTY